MVLSDWELILAAFLLFIYQLLSCFGRKTINNAVLKIEFLRFKS